LMGWDLNELLNEASELPHERILKFSDLRDQVCDPSRQTCSSCCLDLTFSYPWKCSHLCVCVCVCLFVC
jgi:hypothetical protein